jgi:hypothetical protein
MLWPSQLMSALLAVSTLAACPGTAVAGCTFLMLYYSQVIPYFVVLGVIIIIKLPN